MHQAAYNARRLACAYFFACPGLSYGMLLSRLPALKMQTDANDAQIGVLLLCLGCASLAGLLFSNFIMARFGSRSALRASSLVMMAGICLCALADSPLRLGIFCAIAGLGMGLTDVAINTQGILLEKRWHAPCMSTMHAAYSIGGVTGSLTGSAFAAFGIAPAINMAAALGLFCCIYPWAAARLSRDDAGEKKKSKMPGIFRMPFFVLLCGILSMLAYAAEGSVAEWGSLLLYDAKGASEQTAALVFAVFCVTMAAARLMADKLRGRHGDFRLMLCGAALAFCGMLIVLLSPLPALCLAGYAIMGIGLAPIVPILFSNAGSCPGVNAHEASAAVAILSYSGLLFFPPFLGFMAQAFGLERSLLTVLCACALLAIGSPVLRSRNKS